MKFDSVSGLSYRENTHDLDIIRNQKDYRIIERVHFVGGTILDLGGHIGAFANWISKLIHPYKVVSVEPDKDNIKLFNMNRKFSNIALYEGAVNNSGKKTFIYIPKEFIDWDSSPSGITTKYMKGRLKVQVKGVQFKKLLKLKPALIKCDIEGGEYDLDWSNLPDCVKTICIEFHAQYCSFPEKRALRILKIIEDQNFKQVKKFNSKKFITQFDCIVILSR